MPRKRYAAPEQLLRAVIDALERGSSRDAVLLLLEHGPLWTPEAYETERDRDVPDVFGHDDDGRPIFTVSVIGGELLKFLRDLVRFKDADAWALGIHLRAVTVFGSASDGGRRISLSAKGTMRETVILQLLLLVYTVGVGNVRVCNASDCPRLYVKTYRREFCSPRCQKREQMREYRAQIRERQRRRKLKGVAR